MGIVPRSHFPLSPTRTRVPGGHVRPGDPRPVSALARWLLPFLMLAAIVRLWLMPLPSSFWVDEMGTVFVVEHGASHPSLAVAPQVTESIYYLLPAISRRLPGPREIAYRLPSVAAMAAALWIIARLAARLLHPEAGWLAAFACLSLHGINYQAA